MPGGRPSGYTLELTNDICRQLAEGKSMLEVTARADMPAVSTVYLWLTTHKEFVDRYTRAREQQAHTITDRAAAMALNGHRVISDPPVAKVQLDAIKWTAARLAPKVYGSKAELNLGGQAENPLTQVIRCERS
jgi:hypothetical protein